MKKIVYVSPLALLISFFAAADGQSIDSIRSAIQVIEETAQHDEAVLIKNQQLAEEQLEDTKSEFTPQLKVKKQKKQLVRLQAEVDAATRELNDYKNENASLKLSLTTYQEKLDQEAKRASIAEKRVTMQNEELAALKTKNQEMSNEIGHLTTSLTINKELLAQAKQDHQEKATYNNSLQEKLAQVQKERSALETTIAALKEEHKTLSEEHEQAQRTLAKAELRLQELEQESVLVLDLQQKLRNSEAKLTQTYQQQDRDLQTIEGLQNLVKNLKDQKIALELQLKQPKDSETSLALHKEDAAQAL